MTAESVEAGGSDSEPTQDPITGKWVKRMDRQWWCGKNKFLSWSWRYKSFERMYAEKVNVTDPWLFTTMTHLNLLLAEGSTPPYTEVTHEVGVASPSISVDRLECYMALTYTVHVKETKFNTTTNQTFSPTSPTYYAN